MAQISYAAVLKDNLKQSPLYLEQIEVVLDVSNAKPDPLTLQQIRDEDSIKDCSLARRKNINELIADYNEQLRKAPNQAAAEKLLKEFNGKLVAEIGKLQKELQTRADAFANKQKKEVNDLFWARAKLVCRVLYSVGKLVKGGLEMVAKVQAAMAGGVFLGTVAIKALIASTMDLKAAAGDIVDALEGERTQFVKLQAAVKRLKSYKAPKPVPQSDIDAVEAMLGPYGARLLGVDSAAKAAAGKLDDYLKEMDKGKFRDKTTLAAAEKIVDETIQRIIELSKNAATGRSLLQSARTKVADASKRAKADPASWWDYVPTLWKVVDGALDIHEEMADAEGWFAKFDKAVEVVRGKLEDEFKDAKVEEATKL